MAAEKAAGKIDGNYVDEVLKCGGARWCVYGWSFIIAGARELFFGKATWFVFLFVVRNFSAFYYLKLVAVCEFYFNQLKDSVFTTGT